jgi:hypothetical protein
MERSSAVEAGATKDKALWQLLLDKLEDLDTSYFIKQRKGISI